MYSNKRFPMQNGNEISGSLCSYASILCTVLYLSTEFASSMDGSVGRLIRRLVRSMQVTICKTLRGARALTSTADYGFRINSECNMHIAGITCMFDNVTLPFVIFVHILHRSTNVIGMGSHTS